MPILTDDKYRDIHRLAKKQFDAIVDATYDQREESLADRRFYSISGAMYEGSLEEQFKNKPKFEFNKIHKDIIRIFNDYRNNRIDVDFISKKGEKTDELADTCDDLYRADEADSQAEEAYDNCFEEGVGGGFGAFRLRADYEDDEDEYDEKQRVCFEPIYDADNCVFFDANSKRQDKSDAKHGFVLVPLTEDAYKEEWDDEPSSWEKPITQTIFDWTAPDLVYIAEYYIIEYEKGKTEFFQMIDGSEEKYTDKDFESNEELRPKLEAIGAIKVREKPFKRQRVHKYIMSGGGILEDCGLIAGKYIPIIPYYGKRWFVDGKERWMGHVRLLKDPSRLKNMQYSRLAELSALSPNEKPVFTPEQIQRHSLMWEEDNVKNYPYLLIDPIKNVDGSEIPAGAVDRVKPPDIPPATAALLQVVENDIQDMLGNQQGGEEIASNISGRAIELIQARLDMQSYIYISNFAKSLKWCGKVWLSMSKDLFVEENREMKTIGTQGEKGQVILNKLKLDETGKEYVENDMSRADFDINVEIGPTSSSKRASTVRNLLNMIAITKDQTTAAVLEASAMMNMEGEGLSELRPFFRKKLVSIGAIEPNEEEIKEMQQQAASQSPDANAIYLQAAAQEAAAKANKAEADTYLSVAKAEETRAKTAETLAKVGREEREEFLETIEKIQEAPAQPQEMSEELGEMQ